MDKDSKEIISFQVKLIFQFYCLTFLEFIFYCFYLHVCTCTYENNGIFEYVQSFVKEPLDWCNIQIIRFLETIRFWNIQLHTKSIYGTPIPIQNLWIDLDALWHTNHPMLSFKRYLHLRTKFSDFYTRCHWSFFNFFLWIFEKILS